MKYCMCNCGRCCLCSSAKDDCNVIKGPTGPTGARGEKGEPGPAGPHRAQTELQGLEEQLVREE